MVNTSDSLGDAHDNKPQINVPYLMDIMEVALV